MKSWSSYLPILMLALGLITVGASVAVYVIESRPQVATPEPAPAVDTELTPVPRPVAVSTIGQARPGAPRPESFREILVLPADQILLEEQREPLLKHLARVRLELDLPSAMSYASSRRGSVSVLSGASAKDAGLFLFSEKGGTRLTTGARKFLSDFFKDSFVLTAPPHEDQTITRRFGRMSIVRGTSATGQRFDAYLWQSKKTGFNHLLFFYDPTLATATKRLIVDSIRITK